MKKSFYQGLTYEDYLDQMTPARRDGFAASYDQVELAADDLSDLARLRCPIYVAAFSEDWCGDCRINLPVLAKLAESSCLEVRCFSRDAFPEMVQALHIERIPTFVFFNQNFDEIGRWVERPHAVSLALSGATTAAQRTTRVAYNQGRFHSDTIEEILDLLHA